MASFMAEHPTQKYQLYTKDDNDLLEQLGHTEKTPTCFLIVYFLPVRDDAHGISDQKKRAITHCLPPSYFSRSEVNAKRLREIVQGVADETSMEKETSLFNILLNLAQLVIAAVSAYCLRRRPRDAPIQAAPILYAPVQGAHAARPDTPRARRSRNPSDD